ncbi:MAG TPA: histidinol-phosphatase HisJ family protein [Bacillota bacterium]|nr:histidinol-phosphatase HisJ family protein [Bacillota bacterium]
MSPIRVDYHIHSRFSVDSQSSLARCCLAARQAGIEEICFTDHLDVHPVDPGFGYFDPAGYCREVTALAGFPGVGVRLGLEVGFDRHSHPDLLAYLEAHPLPLDFVLGSVHVVEDRLLDTSLLSAEDLEPALCAYFDEVEAAVRAAAGGRLFDVLGHLDVFKRYLPGGRDRFRLPRFRDRIDSILGLAAAGGVGLEINTSGLRHRLGETLPALEVVRRFRELGGEVLTVGSDSHREGDVGSGIDAALDVARAAGFRAITTFRQRQPVWVDIV